MEYNLDYAIARLQNSQIFWNARVLQALFERQSKQDVYYMADGGDNSFNVTDLCQLIF